MSEKLPISECHRAGRGAQGDGLADVGLVAGDVQFGVFGQKSRADRDVVGVGRTSDKSGMAPPSAIRRCTL